MAGILDFLNLGAATPTPINPYGEANLQRPAQIQSPTARQGILGNIDPSALIAAGGTLLAGSRSAGVPMSTGQLIGQGILAAQDAQNQARQRQMEEIKFNLAVRDAELQDQVKRRELALDDNRRKFLQDFGSKLTGAERLLFEIAPDEVIKSKLQPRGKKISFVPGTGIAVDSDTGEMVADYTKAVLDAKRLEQPQINIDLGEKKGAEELFKYSADAIGKADAASAEAQNANNLYDVMESVVDAANTGKFGEYALQAQQTLAFLGLPNNAAPAEVFKAISGQLELQAAQALKGQGQITEFERKIVAQQIPVLSQSPAGIKAIIGVNRALNQIDIEFNDRIQKELEDSDQIVLSTKELNKIRNEFRARSQQIVGDFLQSYKVKPQPEAPTRGQPPSDGGYEIDLNSLGGPQ